MVRREVPSVVGTPAVWGLGMNSTCACDICALAELATRADTHAVVISALIVGMAMQNGGEIDVCRVCKDQLDVAIRTADGLAEQSQMS
jgi:ribose 5-phosphate isomerase